MRIHHYEKLWLMIGSFILIIFLSILAIQTFFLDMGPPSHAQTINPETVRESELFANAALTEIGENEYKLAIIAEMFAFRPGDLEIPAGSTVHFTLASPDVTHGFKISDTNVNVMVVPGHISKVSHTFSEPGEYLILCNEYCGLGHEYMANTITVK
ncbi:cytochrome c oxidase subunit II [Planococcus lenghuensis]|uniref:Cytochrome aa3 subunit 2 n=1 Tax=Planococcus lenghuensis TaxID=2213202 RepID=A0A1Q2KZ32_9BACL|nr:cytochrome c oxidase subunit II [Planococcus lenghuensis]AQQ53384.1 cytochrome C oxidase subunit II [Planococcus lenghuensis]